MSTRPYVKRPQRRPFDWSTAAIAVIVATAATVVLLRDGRDRFLEILESDVVLFGAMLLKVLAGCLIGAFLTLLLPRDRVARWVGAESGWLGLVIATVAGAILPGGPLTIYPVASAFLVMGADVGATVAFVTSWTLLGYGRALVWELPFFGPDFVLWRMVAALPLPLVTGILARLAVSALGAHWKGRA